MTQSSASSGYGCLLKMGDGGVGAGTQASRTISTSNQQVIIKALKAGTAGNSKTCSIAVSGNNTPFSFTCTATTLSIISATDGSAVATTKVGYLISQLYLNETFRENWQATTGAGDGSGVLAAAASAALSGGAEGTEVFTEIAEVKSISGPNTSSQVIDVTHMGSSDNTREFLPTLIDPGDISMSLNFRPDNDTHIDLRVNQKERTRTNWQLVFTDPSATVYSFAGYVTGFQITAEIESALQAQCTVKLTSWPDEA